MNLCVSNPREQLACSAPSEVLLRWLNWFWNHLSNHLIWQERIFCPITPSKRWQSVTFTANSLFWWAHVQYIKKDVDVWSLPDSDTHRSRQGQAHWHKATQGVIPSLTSRCAGQHTALLTTDRWNIHNTHKHTRTHRVIHCVGRSWQTASIFCPQEIHFTHWENWLCWRGRKEKNSSPLIPFPFWPSLLSSQVKPLTYLHTFTHIHSRVKVIHQA